MVVGPAKFYFSLGNVDLVVIGSGPGGYVAAIKAAQLGMKVQTLLCFILLVLVSDHQCFVE